MAGPASAGLVVRLVRWTLPVALLGAAVVALLGLGGIVLTAPPETRPTPEVALNLTRAPALPVADDGAAGPGGLVPGSAIGPGAVAPGAVPPPVNVSGAAAAPAAPNPDCAPPPVCS